MKSIIGWARKSAIVALTITALAACADSPPTGPANASATATRKMVADCDTPDGCCSPETALIECSGDGGGGGGGGAPVPNNDVKLTWFSDHGQYFTNEYYELRHRFINSAGTQFHYNAQFIHGDAFARGEFTSLNLGRPFPCGGRIDIDYYRLNIGWFGHVTSAELKGFLTVYDGQQGVSQSFSELPTPSAYPPPLPGLSIPLPPASATYTWPAGTCQ